MKGKLMTAPDDVDEETRRVWGFLGNMPIGHSTLTRKQLKSLLLKTDGSIICNGRLRDICSKHIGAGVYKVWTER